jgi:N6-adenosine-specific RNA methylase IME4
MWWLGDWLRFGERKWGEQYKEAVDVTGYEYGTLRNAKMVADRFDDLSRRRDNLSFAHHQEVASLPQPDADRLLEEAASGGLSRNELRSRVSRAHAASAILASEPGDGTCTIADLLRAAQLGKKFGTIYADPPWQYDNQGTRAATGNHYGGMSVDELCELPVSQLAADDAHLHLWTTNAFLFECPRIFEAWGFEFRSTFVWVKPQIGIGNYWRNSHEFLLTAIRGDAKRFNDHSMTSWLEASWLKCDRGAHSAKPERVRSFIERASPGPRLELFGRRVADGWSVWGNQIERSLFAQDVREVA